MMLYSHIQTKDLYNSWFEILKAFLKWLYKTKHQYVVQLNLNMYCKHPY